MCIALPMKALETNGLCAKCAREGKEILVDTSLLAEVSPGDWLLVFQDRALRKVEEAEAQEIEAALRATALVMSGQTDEDTIRAGFADLIDREPELPPHLRAQLA